jgi:hypothetical protein
MKKEYSALLKKEEYSPQKQMVTAIDKMVKSDGIKKDKQLLKELKMLLEVELSNSSSNSDIINYSDWLKLKIN